MLTRRLFLIAAPLLAAGCATRPDAPETAGPLTLRDVFLGEVRGRGLFRVDLTGAERRFTARLHGRMQGE